MIKKITSILSARRKHYAALPTRVHDAIDQQQIASERMIGWFQFAIVVSFWTLYTLTPKAFIYGQVLNLPYLDHVTFEPVPVALGCYAVLTLSRLYQAHRGRLRPWHLYASVIVDMALLFGVIWSFHLQYQQPPSFYLKSPAALYVFIFIAMRALSFQARYVVLAGVAAIVGWAFLVIYAIRAPDGDAMITNNYTEYMTSNSILIGAEFDKIFTVLVVTVIIAVAILRARNLLIQSVSESAAAAELSRFFSPEIARQITEADQEARPGTGEARLAAVMFCDIRGFTSFAGTEEPSAVVAMLSEYQQALLPAIQKHNGAIDKFMGDGIMATFGAAVPSNSCAADAARAVPAVLEAARLWNAQRAAAGKPTLRVNTAIAYGSIIFGAIGGDDRLEYTVIGDSVNLAAKLEKANKVLGVSAVTDQATFEAAVTQGYRHEGAIDRRDGVAIDGVDEKYDIAVLAP